MCVCVQGWGARSIKSHRHPPSQVEDVRGMLWLKYRQIHLMFDYYASQNLTGGLGGISLNPYSDFVRSCNFLQAWGTGWGGTWDAWSGMGRLLPPFPSPFRAGPCRAWTWGGVVQGGE